MTQDLIAPLLDIDIEKYRTEVKDAIIKHDEYLTSKNLNDIENKDLITNSNNYKGPTSFYINQNLNFIQQQPNKDSTKKIYEGFGAYSTLQGFQQNIPFITFKLGTNRHRERKITSTKEAPVLVLEITRQYLNTLLQITEKKDSDMGYTFENISKAPDENEDEEYSDKFENYITITYENIRKELFKTYLAPHNFGQLPNINAIKDHSSTTSSETAEFLNEHSDLKDKTEKDGFAQALSKDIFDLPINLLETNHNYGHIRVKEVNQLEDLYIDYHTKILKEFFKIDISDYSMLIVEDDENLKVDTKRMAAILITNGLNVDKKVDIQFSDGILEIEHLTDLSKTLPEDDRIQKLKENKAILDQLITNINDMDNKNEYAVKLYEVDKQILDSCHAQPLPINGNFDSIREFQHGFAPGDLIVIPQKHKLHLSTKINGHTPDNSLEFTREIKIVFEVVDLIEDPDSPYQDKYGAEVIRYLKDTGKFDTDNLDYSDFRQDAGEDTSIMGIDILGEKDYDVDEERTVDEDTDTFTDAVY